MIIRGVLRIPALLRQNTPLVHNTAQTCAFLRTVAEETQTYSQEQVRMTQTVGPWEIVRPMIRRKLFPSADGEMWKEALQGGIAWQLQFGNPT